MAQICMECTEAITNKQLLICSICAKKYHLDCTSVTFKRFRIMTPANKKAFRCHHCLNKLLVKSTTNKAKSPLPESCLSQAKSPLPESCSSSDNLSEQELSDSSTDTEIPTLTNNSTEDESCVTIHDKFRVNIATENSFADLPIEVNSNNLNLNTSSSINKTDYIIKELKERIEKLEEKLEKAETKIENLKIENTTLFKKISDYEVAVNPLSPILNSTTKTNTQKKKYHNITKGTSMNLNIERESKDTKDKQTDLDSKTTSYIPKKSTIGATTAKDNTKVTESTQIARDEKRNDRKMCLISSTTDNVILKLAENNLHYSEVCHFKHPESKIRQLLHGIENKLKNFSVDDFCVIFIGEADFNDSVNLQETVNYIKISLRNVQHTNIIICLPTYKHTKFVNIFNKRIEMFNKLLYSDNLIYEYAYILDSNENLEYSFDYFTKTTGRINTYGYKTIFTNLNELVMFILSNRLTNNFIEPNNSQSHTSELIDSQKFFRK